MANVTEPRTQRIPSGGAAARRGGMGTTLVLAGGIVLALLLAAGVMFTGAGASGPERTGPAAVPLPPQRAGISTPLAESEPTGLDVPSIDVTADSIMDLGLNPDRTLEVPTDAKTIGWFSLGTSPGAAGPAVFASHVNYDGVEGGFADLAEMKAGDQVLVPRADGITAAFVVDRVDSVGKDEFPTEAVYGDTTRPEIRLITCGGEFDASTRNYENNIIVYGHLTEAYRT